MRCCLWSDWESKCKVFVRNELVFVRNGLVFACASLYFHILQFYPKALNMVQSNSNPQRLHTFSLVYLII